MARKSRIHVRGGFYHVTQRGQDGRDIFRSPGDGAQYLDLLAGCAARFDLRVHAYCLLPAGVHLVLETGAAPLSAPMQSLSLRHTRHLNRRENRAGPVFRGRYRAVLVDPDRFLPALVRYVHLAPVRVGLVKAPESWRWSSHRAYLGRVEDRFLTTETVLGQLEPRRDRAQAAFAGYMADEAVEGYRAEFHTGNGAGGRVLGDDDFVARVLAPQADRRGPPPAPDAVVTAVAREYGLAEAELAGPSRARRLSEARGLAGFLARESGAASMSDFAARFRRDLSSVSRAVRRVEERLQADPGLRERLARINGAIMQV